jgi:predicted small secreted protein
MVQKKLAALMVLVGFVAGAVGCNTIEGIGKDVKAAGGAVEKAAEKTKTY